MQYFSLIVPTMFFGVFLFALFKKVNVYDGFVKGAKGAVPLIVDVFPYLVAMFLLTELMEKSGLSAWLCNALAPLFNAVGVPKELIKLLLVKPFSGSGATALFAEILKTNPPDSYIARCAAVCFGSSETTFYISAVYFSRCKGARLPGAIAFSLLASFISSVFACFICKFI